MVLINGGGVSMAQIGNKQNSKLNGQWAAHVRGWWKRFTSKKRRNSDKKIIREGVREA